LNQEQILKVDLGGEFKSVFIRFNSRNDDIDIKQDFDLGKGNRIQFAMIEDQLKVSQRNDRNFPSIPFQFKKKGGEEEQKR